MPPKKTEAKTEAKAELIDVGPEAKATRPLFFSNYGLVLTVYLLYLAGFITGLTSVVGVIIATLQADSTDQICATHFQFQIRTFWIGLLYAFIGLMTLHFGVGAMLLLWWIVWTIIRCVKGMLALNQGEPIGDPRSWWFG